MILVTKVSGRRISILVIVYLIALLSSVYLTFAYYTKEEHTSIILTSGDANISVEIAFDDLIIDQNSQYYDSVKKQIIINSSDPLSENAISKLRVTVNLESDYASRVRVKLMESYVKSRYYIATEVTLNEVMAVTENRSGFHPFSYLSHGEGYEMIYTEDGYQYLPSILLENEMLQLPIVSGGLTTYARTNTQYIETITLYLAIVIEVVQANRYQEVWGISPTIFME